MRSGCRHSLGNLVAGQGGIDKEIQSITVIEVPDRSEFCSLISAISSMCVIADNLKNNRTNQIAQQDEGSGLVVFNVVGAPSINPQLIELCNELDFP